MDNVGMLGFEQHINLSQGGDGEAFLLLRYLQFLQSHYLSCNRYKQFTCCFILYLKIIGKQPSSLAEASDSDSFLPIISMVLGFNSHISTFTPVTGMGLYRIIDLPKAKCTSMPYKMSFKIVITTPPIQSIRWAIQ